MQFPTKNRRQSSRVMSAISSEKEVDFQPREKQRKLAYVVEIEYGATEDVDNKLLMPHDSVSIMLEVRGNPSDAERREKVVKILAEAVCGYLKKMGLLTAQAGHVAENAPPQGHSWDGKTFDE